MPVGTEPIAYMLVRRSKRSARESTAPGSDSGPDDAAVRGISISAIACATASGSPARTAYSRAIVPASDDSSTTIWVARSNLPSAAARRTVATSSSLTS